MKKNLLLAAACVAMVVPATAFAGDLDVYFDIRPTFAEIATPAPPWTNTTSIGGGAAPAYPLPNGGMQGDAQVRWVSPTVPGNLHIVGLLDASVQSAYLYADFNGNPGEVVAALGVDMAITAGSARTIADTNFTMDGSLWDGTAISTAFDATGGGIKGVQVPVAAGPPPSFDPNQGIGPGAGWQIGELEVVGGPYVPDMPVAYELHMTVNNLLCARVAAGGAAALGVSFGYDGAGNPDAAVDGGTPGIPSANPDLLIIVKTKGDFFQDGLVQFPDLSIILAALADIPGYTNLNPNDLWCSEFDGTPGISFADLSGFLALLNGLY